MRDYGRIHCAFWTSADIQAVSDDGRFLALYLLSSPHTTMIGAFRLPDGYVCEDLKWTPERVAKGFGELLAKGFANRCETTKWVWIRKFLQWNQPENPNQWKAARKIAAQIPGSCSWKVEFFDYFGSLVAAQENPSETVSKGSRNQDQDQDQDQDDPTAAKKPPRARKRSEDPEWLADFKREYPDRHGGQEWRKAIRAANRRIAEGHTPDEFIAGAKRYHAHCKSLDKIGSPYVKQAATFLGPDKHFLEPWPAAASKPTRPAAPSPVSTLQKFPVTA